MKDMQNEQFIVVNEKDEIMGYKSRFECHHNNNLIHRSVDIALFNSEGKIALQKRSEQKDLYPGYYSVTASGHVSKGENYIDAALRELKEEMGVEGIDLKQQDTFIVKNKTETEMTVLFTGIYNGQFTYPADEVASIHYLSRDEVQQIPIKEISSVDALKHLGWLL